MKKWMPIETAIVLILLFSDQHIGRTNGETLSIDHAYLRRISEYDNGTVHLYLRNMSERRINITKIFLNGQLLAGENSDHAIWYQTLPNPIEPGKVGDVMVKLRSATKESVDISIETSEGEKYHQTVKPVNPPLRFTYVGFSDALDKIYVYLENTGTEPLSVKSIYLDTDNVTSLSKSVWDGIVPGGKQCIVLRPRMPLNQGEYIAIKLETEQEQIAETLVMVFSFFPINFEDGSTRSGLNLNSNNFIMSYPTQSSSLLARRGGPFSQTIYPLLDCPMHAHGTESEAGMKIIRLAEAGRRLDPFHPGCVGICRNRLEKSYFIFGETADAVRINPNQICSYFHPSPTKEHITQWITALAKKACEPRPLYTSPVVTKNTPYFDKRYPTSEEVRLMTYYEISRGSNGILYRASGWDGFINDYPKIKEEMVNINAELQHLKKYLKIGEVVSLAKSNNPWVEAATILAGDESIVLILINHETESDYKSTIDPFTYVYKDNLEIKVEVPEKMLITSVYEIDRGAKKKIEFQHVGSDIVIRINRLDITKHIVLTH